MRIPRAGNYQSGTPLSLGVFPVNAGPVGGVFHHPTEGDETVAHGVGAGEITLGARLVAPGDKLRDVGRYFVAGAPQHESHGAGHLTHGGGECRGRGGVAGV
jgi:hypothetical protein